MPRYFGGGDPASVAAARRGGRTRRRQRITRVIREVVPEDLTIMVAAALVMATHPNPLGITDEELIEGLMELKEKSDEKHTGRNN